MRKLFIVRLDDKNIINLFKFSVTKLNKARRSNDGVYVLLKLKSWLSPPACFNHLTEVSNETIQTDSNWTKNDFE